MKPKPLTLPICAVTFDVGGTLLEPWPSVGEVYAQVAAEHGITGAAPATLNRQFAAAWRARRDFDHSRPMWAEVVAASFAGIADRASCDAMFPAIYDRFARRGAWRLFPDARPALGALQHSGLKLAVISNWDERLHALLKQFDLTPHFAVVVVSFEVGFRKPSSEIFHCAAERLGLPPSAILHVGDSPVEDVAGARGAGCAALQVCRERGRPAKGVAGSLLEVPAWLGLPSGTARPTSPH